MLCRLLDASKEDYKFLPILSHAFLQELAKASEVECNWLNYFSDYLNRPCFRGTHGLNARDKLSRLD